MLLKPIKIFKNQKTMIIFALVIFLFVILSSIITSFYANNSQRSNYKKIFENEIRGRVTYYEFNTGFVYFKINNLSEYYALDAREINKSTPRLSRIIENNDSIYKKQNSDTIKLIKKDREYIYLIKKRF